MDKEIRLLKAGEIECRIGTINERGASLLLYKDARVDQKILDEAFGTLGWKRSHQCIDGQVFCTVEVWDDDKKQWIGKQDVGTAGTTEQVKGTVSDSFKRACFNLGIGRELYTAPFIWIGAEKMRIDRTDRNGSGRFMTKDRFFVQSIGYNEEREITSVTITNDRGAVVYSNVPSPNGKAEGKGEGISTRQKDSRQKKAVVMEGEDSHKAGTEKQADGYSGISLTKQQLIDMEEQLMRTGIPLMTVLERYGINAVGQMTQEIYEKAMRSLRRTKTAA